MKNKTKKQLKIKTLEKLPLNWFKLTPFEQLCFKRGILSEEQSKEIIYKFANK